MPGDNQCRAREHTALTLRHATLDLLCDPRATADELPALLDDSSDEDEPVSGVRIDASPGKPDFFVTSLGKPDFFVTLTTVDEFSCARRRQDVSEAAGELVNGGRPRSRWNQELGSDRQGEVCDW